MDQAAEVTAFWSELGLDGLIDVHTHFMPANVMRKVWAYFDNVAVCHHNAAALLGL
jgi:hypothetical protein